MKNYKKKPTKLLQIRFSDEEYTEIIRFIKKFGVTHRSFMLAAKNELELGEYGIIKDGFFYIDEKDYAYSFGSKWDRQIDENSKCELCGTGYYDYNYMQGRKEYNKTLLRHHHDGYSGENAFKTHIVCRKCHGYCHRKENIKLGFEEVQEKYKLEEVDQSK